MHTMLRALGASLLLLVGIMQAPAQSVGRIDVVRLAEAGDARAQTSLGFMLETGRGLPQNYIDAVYWYGRAAEQGDPDAQYLLGNCFSLGLGTPIDLVQAHKWFNLSASRTRAREEREHRIRMRDAIASTFNTSTLEYAHDLAATWRRKPERRLALPQHIPR
jgi:TPR repeat protein